MNAEQELYDTGRESLPWRLFFVAVGLALFYVAWLALAQTVLGALATAFLGLVFIGMWVYRARLYYDAGRRELLWRAAVFGTHRTSLKDAVAVSGEKGRKNGYVYLHYPDRPKKLAVIVGWNEGAQVANAVSQAAGLPLAPA